MAKFKKFQNPNNSQSKDFKELHTAIMVNVDWLNESIDSEEPQEDSVKAFQRAIMFILVIIDDRIVRVIIPENNRNRINWGQPSPLYLMLAPSKPITSEDIDLTVQRIVDEMMVGDPPNMFEIEPWRCKTFGLFKEQNYSI